MNIARESEAPTGIYSVIAQGAFIFANRIIKFEKERVTRKSSSLAHKVSEHSSKNRGMNKALRSDGQSFETPLSREYINTSSAKSGYIRQPQRLLFEAVNAQGEKACAVLTPARG